MKPKYNRPTFRHTSLLAASAVIVFTHAASAADNLDAVSDWDNYLSTNPTSTNYFWGDTAMWDNGIVPDGVGAKANLAIDLNGAGGNATLSPSIRLSDPGAPTTPVVRTLGSLSVGDTSSTGPTDGTVTNFAFGSFNFDNGGAGATLTTASSTLVQNTGFPPFAAITMSSMNLNDNLTITNNMGPAAGTFDSSTLSRSSLQINGITETGGPRNVTYTGTGVGTTAVSAASYTGNTSILNGRVSGNDSTSFGTGTVTVSSGAQAQIVTSAGTFGNDFVLNGNGWSESSGAHGALYIAANSTSGAKLQTFNGSINIASASLIEAWSNVTADLNGAITGSAALELKGGVINLNGTSSGYTGTATSTQGQVNVNGTFGGNLAVTSFASTLGGKGTISGNLELGAIAGPPLGTTFVADNTTAGNLHVGGDLTVTSATAIQLADHTSGTYTVMDYSGTLTGGGNFTYAGHTGSGVDTATSGLVKVTTVQATMTWNGGDSGVWQDLGTGWTGLDGTFYNGDNVTFDGTAPGTVTVSGKISAGTITFSGANDYTLEAASGNSIASGSLVKNGTGTLTIGTSTSNQNTFAGGTTINGGTVRLSATGNLTSGYGPLGTGDITMNGGTLSSAGTGSRTIYNKLNINGNVALGAGTDTGNLTFYGGTQITANSSIDVGSNVVTIGSTSATYAGSDLSGSSNLTMTGSGILKIGRDSTYDGAISVQGGNFQVSTSLSTNGGGSLAISAGGTLSGGNTTGTTGTVNVSTSIAGTHKVGTATSASISNGLQTFSAGLTYAASATYAMEMTDEATATRGTKFDAVNVTGGTFDLASGASMTLAFATSTGTFGVDFNDAFWDTDQQWLIIDLGSGVTGDGGTGTFDIGAITGGRVNGTYQDYQTAGGLGTFSTSRITDANGKNDVYLNWTAIPEPSSALLALLGVSAFGFRRRRA